MLKTGDFKKVYENAKSLADKYLVVYILKNESGGNRLGISVSKKIGNSVTRNRIRRRIKEYLRVFGGDILQAAKGFDFVILARKPAAEADFHILGESLKRLITKAIVKNEKNVNQIDRAIP